MLQRRRRVARGRRAVCARRSDCRRCAQPSDAGDRADRDGVVPGDDLDGDVLLGEVARASRCASGRTRCSRTTSATRASPVPACERVVDRHGRCGRAAAPAGPCEPEFFRVGRGRRCSAGSSSTSRRAEQPVAVLSRTTAPLHFFAEENGAIAVCSRPAGAVGKRLGDRQHARVRARVVAARAASAVRAASSRSPAPSAPSTSSTSASRMPFSVRVPVLSAQTTSTRASPSIAGSSWTRHCRRPEPDRRRPRTRWRSCRTRPSGTIGTSAATMPLSDGPEAVVAGEQLVEMISTTRRESSGR